MNHRPRLSILAATAAFLLAATALAQDTATAVASTAPVLTSREASWIGLFTALFVTAAQFVDPANIQTPGNWTGQSRVIAFSVLGALVGLGHYLTAQTGAPIMASLFTGVLTIVVPMLGHFATGFGKSAIARMSAARTVGAVPPVRGGQAGFTRLAPLLLIVGLSGCAAAIAAIIPAAALVSCGILVDVDNPGLTFPQYCTKVIAQCGGDLETLFAALIASKDPRLAGRAAEAKETQKDPAKMAALRGFVAAHRAEYAHPAAP